MKIGEFAEKFDIKKSTVRYYTDIKLLLPIKTGHSNEYDEKAVRDMEEILNLRNMGFTIDEVAQIKTFERLHINYSEDQKEFIKEIFEAKMNELNEERLLIENKIDNVNKYKEEILVETTGKQIGIAVEFLNYLICPRCGEELELIDGIIKNMIISHGALKCHCGYSAKIEDGMLFSTDKPLNMVGALHNENETWKEKIARVTPETMASVVESGAKIRGHQSFWDEGDIYLFTGADADILIMRLNEVFREDGLYIFACIYTDILKALKRTMEILDVPGKFLFINHFDEMPLKHCADRVLDNAGYFIEMLNPITDIDTLNWISSGLQKDAQLLSVAYSLKDGSKTFVDKPEYKPYLLRGCHKERFEQLNLDLISEEELGGMENVSDIFPIISEGDCLEMTLYKLKAGK